MAIYLFLQILKFTKYSIKLIEKLSRRHLINSSDVFVIKGFTVHIYKYKLDNIIYEYIDNSDDNTLHKWLVPGKIYFLKRQCCDIKMFFS